MKNPLRERIVRYKGKGIVVYFHVDRCTHVAECLNGLPQVFNTLRTPWILPDNAPADLVGKIIIRCPTGALHFRRLDGGEEEAVPETNIVSVQQDGPLYVWADVEVISGEGTMLLEDTRVALCRCGSTRHAPFCDGLHSLDNFQDSPDFGGPVQEPAEPVAGGKLRIVLQTNGPYTVTGPVTIQDQAGRVGFQGKRFSLCSCGRSQKKPLCDGSHAR